MAREQAERIGRRMRERRKELGLNQRDVADRTGKVSIDGNTISRWERGRNRPEDGNLDLVAKALETSAADLVAGPEAERGGVDTPDLVEAMGDADGQLRALLREVRALHGKLDRLLTFVAGDDAAEELERGAREAGRALERASRETGEGVGEPATAAPGRR